MPTYKPLDVRQSLFRGLLSQIAAATGTTLDQILIAINTELSPPLNVLANTVPNLIVNVGTSLVVDTGSGIQRTFSFINNVIPYVSSGTVTFPSTNGGTVTSSTGNTATLTVTSGQYAQVLLWLDNAGNIGITAGSSFAAGSLLLAAQDTTEVPVPTANTLSFAYVTVFNNAGTISNLSQSNITQLLGGGSSGGTPVTPSRIAAEVPLSSGDTSIVVTLPITQTSNNYVVLPQFVNTVDADPEYQPITITNRTTTTFTASWNSPLTDNNYFLDYVLSAAISQIGEYPISSGSTSITISLPTPLASNAYVVIADFTNTTDAFPQFQPILITQKTATTFTASWNAPTEDGSYLLSWQLASYQP